MTKEEELKLKLSTDYDGQGVEQAKDGVDDLKDEVSALDELLNNASDFEEAFKANDVDKAKKSLDRMRKSLTRLAKETGNEANPELEELNQLLKDAEGRLDDLDAAAEETGDGLEDLNDKANESADSLKRIEALEVAAALRESIENARASGRAFASLGDNSKNAEEKILEATSAVSAFAASARAAYTALGPWGIALAAIVTVLQLVVEAQQDSTEALLDQIDAEHEAARAASEAAEEKRKAAERSAEDIAWYNAMLDDQLGKLDKEIEIVNEATEAYRQKARAQQELEDAQLALELAQVDAGLVRWDDGDEMTELERMEYKIRLREEHEQRRQQLEKETLEQVVSGENEKVKKSEDGLEQLAEEDTKRRAAHRRRMGEIESEIKALKRKASELEKQEAIIGSYLDQQINFEGATPWAPDRTDYETSKNFANASEAFLVGKDLPRSSAAVEKLQGNLERQKLNDKAIEAKESELETLRKKEVLASEKYIAKKNEAAESYKEAGEAAQKAADELEHKQQLNEINNQRRGIEQDQTIQKARQAEQSTAQAAGESGELEKSVAATAENANKTVAAVKDAAGRTRESGAALADSAEALGTAVDSVESNGQRNIQVAKRMQQTLDSNIRKQTSIHQQTQRILQGHGSRLQDIEEQLRVLS